MFKISDFSRLSRVSLKTLRFYDHIGILKPAHTDKETGYRFYSAEQLLTLNRILMYKDLGFTLQQIQQLLREDISTEQVQGMFRLKEREITQLLEVEQTRLKRIKERLLLIEREGRVEKEQEVVIKSVEAQKIISFCAHGFVEEIPKLFDALSQYVGKQNRRLLPQMVLWKESAADEEKFDLEVAYSLKQDVTFSSDMLNVRMLPEEPMMATLLYRVEPSVPSTACIDLAMWLERNQYRIKKDQPGREIYLQSPEHAGDTYVEVQIPVESKRL
ncbi:MerR family transcriptional regulator [Brevibacillus sp. NRS-1366]|uniref:MerR family transcriptional regulator n=1 Tax=Brevibacillus sp. NRS-1366 TaxID=3233899 RepID=UPI003D235784